jgi:transposase
MFARLKDLRRIATRYDTLARNFLAGAFIAAAAIWWLNSVRPLGLHPQR